MKIFNKRPNAKRIQDLIMQLENKLKSNKSFKFKLTSFLYKAIIFWNLKIFIQL